MVSGDLPRRGCIVETSLQRRDLHSSAFPGIMAILSYRFLSFFSMSGLSKIRAILIGLCLCFASVLVFVFLLEGILRLGWLDLASCSRPIWIPPRFRYINDEINRQNTALAAKNKQGFTDINRNYEKSPGKIRIAILGDSFVWGDGLPNDQVWSKRLEKMLQDSGYQNTEVCSWGRNGWSTADEYAFLKAEGFKYHIYLLIVGWTTNDPDMNLYKRESLDWQDASLFIPIKRAVPYSFDFLSSGINNFIEKTLKKQGYAIWQDRLYRDSNLKQYQALLADFSNYLAINNIPFFFALTPNTYQQEYQAFHNKVIPLFQKAGIPYYSLFPAIANELGHIPIRKLWANPANGHPGPLVTEIYARYVLNYILTTYPHLFQTCGDHSIPKNHGRESPSQ
nr:hypothetical protein [uncultured Gammaproteobacteria bacterium]